MNREARPVAYAGKSAYGSTLQSRYMLVGGLVMGLVAVPLIVSLARDRW